MSEWVTRLPYYAFATYYRPSNQRPIPNKVAVEQWVYHFKQSGGVPHRGQMDFTINGQAWGGSTFDIARELLTWCAKHQKVQVFTQIPRHPARPHTVLVPLPGNGATSAPSHPGGGGRVAEVLAEAGYGFVRDGLRWRSSPKSATRSPGPRAAASEKLELMQWVDPERFERNETVILVDDVASYGDTAMAAANRLYRDHGVTVAGLIVVGRTNGGAQPDAFAPRRGEITATPVSGQIWRASLDGMTSS